MSCCRCVRDDEQSATVRCHYLTDGTVNFAFTIRRSEYFIPAGVLLKCFMEVSDKELYEKLVKSALVVSSVSVHSDYSKLSSAILLISRHTDTRLSRCLTYPSNTFFSSEKVPRSTGEILHTSLEATCRHNVNSQR